MRGRYILLRVGVWEKTNERTMLGEEREKTKEGVMMRKRERGTGEKS